MTACSGFKSPPLAPGLLSEVPQDLDGQDSYGSVSSVPRGLGLVVWSGLPDLFDFRFKRGMDFLFREGFQTFRFVVGPQSRETYRTDFPCDPAGSTFLRCLVSEGELADILGHPRLKIANLVVYDSVTAGEDGNRRKFLNSNFLTLNRAKVIREYEGLAFELSVRFSGTGKQFVISDWEADNIIYCGSAYRFVTNPEMIDPFDANRNIPFRQWCLDRYSWIYGGDASNPDEAMTGYRLWQSLRIEGVRRGRLRAQEHGAKNVLVQAGMEFSTIRLLQPVAYPSAFDQVATQLDFDVVTYSSYESINAGVLKQDLDLLIARLGPNKRLAVSEFGFSEGQLGSSPRTKMRDVVAELVGRLEAREIDHATAWQAFNDGSPFDFGIYSAATLKTEAGEGFWSGIRLSAAAAMKTSITDAGGGCNGCDCGWATGERIPETENLRVQLYDEFWVYLAELSEVDLVRASSNSLTLRVPEEFQGKFQSSGLRFAVLEARSPASYAVGPLVRCQ